MISFEFEEKRYIVRNEAYDLNRIVLPDGTLLKAGIWYESYPPQPGELQVVNHLFKDLEPTAIAEQMNAVVAKEGRRLHFTDEFSCLKPGDKVYYVAGRGTHNVEADAVVVSDPAVSVTVRLTHIHFMGADVEDVSVGNDVSAAPHELFRVQ